MLIQRLQSSGTTGPPKGVEITHRNFVSNAEQVIHLSKMDPNYEERNKKAKWVCFLPLYHAYGQTYFVQIAAKRGVPAYIMPKFDFIQMLEIIQKHKITDLMLVPPIAVALAKSPATKQYDLSSVISAGSGAAPLSRAVCVEVEELWEPGKVNIKVSWLILLKSHSPYWKS
jgi:4-coumarate--CoA ligase